LVVASKGGAARNPLWYHNIKAHPDVQIQDGAATANYSAREIESDERAAWWSLAVKEWPFFEEYEGKTEG
jgi:deazaflavin-dependent oxidoreductase (nitroreductase family)